MRLRLFEILPILMLIFVASCGNDRDSLPDSSAVIPGNALSRLNTTIHTSRKYQEAKEAKFDSLKNLLSTTDDPVEKWEHSITLAEQYRQFNADSAIYYANMAQELSDKGAPLPLRLRSRLSLVNALSTAGLFLPAIQGLDTIRHKISDIPEKIEYWKSSRLLYSYMQAYVQDHGQYADSYRKSYIECDDSLRKHLPKSDPFYRFIVCEHLVDEGRWTDAKASLERLMADQEQESNIYGMAAFQLAEVYKHKGDFRGYATNLALSAESDIKGCVREGLALPTLANWLYEHGDLDNAFNYINYALEDANIGNIRMRTVTIAALMPVIDQAYRKEINDSRNEILIYSVIATIVMLICVGLLAGLVRSFKKMRSNERKLSKSSKKLEAYVGNFIALCSSYASRLDQLSKLVVRKISSGQGEDLVKLISSGRLNEGDNEDFYKIIDKAILDIFPDFVGNINTLLEEENQLTLDNREVLTPELRIYAFVRLGMGASTQIAQILGYSVNTVYAYRNRMRAKAKVRETFDADVANLGTGPRPFRLGLKETAK